jgi:hypothetical protein
MEPEIKLYQPSNGTEGDIFMSRYCFQCAKFPHSSEAKNQCQIVLKTFAYDTRDKEYPNQWRYVNGRTTCTAFKSREEFNAERRAKRKPKSIIATDSQTLDLFS